MKKASLITIGSILIVSAPLSFLAGVVYTLLLPNIYESTAVAQISFPENHSEKYTADALLALTEQTAGPADDSEIFRPVIAELKLQESWGEKEKNYPYRSSIKSCRIAFRSKLMKIQWV
ncbi:hypothetical protein EGM51_16185 [Verrucomicrobia bacterium S94]|nr:hypothetical protein EGM51_16185 [Verrucomicrobia bacterium S94]